MSKIFTFLILIFASFQLFAAQDMDRLLATANQGNAYAAYQVARAYDIGNGVEKNQEKAIDWYRKAALLNEPSAQVVLGLKYAMGKYIERDMQMAYVWFKAAEQNGHQAGERYRAKAEKELTPTQLVSANNQYQEVLQKISQKSMQSSDK